MRRKMLVLLAAATIAIAAAGCGDYWRDQGSAARTAAQARMGQAEAARQNAQAAIIDAEARGALAESQARALTGAMDANTELARTAVSIADNSEYTYLIAVILISVIVALVVVLVALARRQQTVIIQPPHATIINNAQRSLPRAISVDTAAGSVVVEPLPGETRSEYTRRVSLIAAQLDSRLIEAPRR